MRMDGMADVGRLAAHLDGQRDFRDQVAGVHTDDAAADHAIGGLVEQQFGEAFAAADADRARRSHPREFADADAQALGLGLGFGDPDPGDFRIGISHRRDHPRDPPFLFAGRDFGGEFAFVGGLMRQHRLADDVADGEDVRHVGAHLPVDGDEPAFVDLDAGLVGVEFAAIGAREPTATRTRSKVIGPALRRIRGHGDALLGGLDLGRLVLRWIATPLLQARGERLDQVLVGAGISWSMNSTTVTSLPSARYTVAISRPMIRPDDQQGLGTW